MARITNSLFDRRKPSKRVVEVVSLYSLCFIGKDDNSSSCPRRISELFSFVRSILGPGSSTDFYLRRPKYFQCRETLPDIAFHPPNASMEGPPAASRVPGSRAAFFRAVWGNDQNNG